MSPHRLADFVGSNSGTSTPVLFDTTSETEQSLDSSAVEADFYAERQANEPIAIVGIGKRDPSNPSDA